MVPVAASLTNRLRPATDAGLGRAAVGRVAPVRDLVVLVVAVAMSAILVAGCGGGEATTAEPTSQPTATAQATSSQPTTEPTSAPASTPGGGTLIKAAGSQFGQVLFDGTGQAIYLFDKETSTIPECYGDCAQAWPPVLTDGQPGTAGSVRGEMLGTTNRTDGTTQVTYAGHPLYYYAHEGKHEVRCHNVQEFGGLWLAVTPSGAAADH